MSSVSQIISRVFKGTVEELRSNGGFHWCKLKPLSKHIREADGQDYFRLRGSFSLVFQHRADEKHDPRHLWAHQIEWDTTSWNVRRKPLILYDYLYFHSPSCKLGWLIKLFFLHFMGGKKTTFDGRCLLSMGWFCSLLA